MLTRAWVRPRRLTTQRWRIGEQDLAFVILDFMGSSSWFPLMGSHSLPQRFVFGTGKRIRHSLRKIDFSALGHERGF
jgi:hypothetical protein